MKTSHCASFLRLVRASAGLLVLTIGVYAAKPGVAVGLPPFIPVQPPQLTLQTVSPFDLLGFMQKATLDPGCTANIFCGGTMVINGLTIVVPRNTLFQMPAAAITWQELFKLAPPPYGLNTAFGPQSGLALADTPTPFATYEVHVQGNRVIDATGDRYIAGLIFISQQSLNSGQGYINFIDYAKGELWVGSALTPAGGVPAGARVRINTPQGRYGLAQTPDQRFTSDEDNPTITAETGYPMCIPRFDPKVNDDSLCPQRNRPVDPVTKAFQTIFTMPPPGSALPSTAPDATQQLPFEVGDYITYAGTLVKDPACAVTAANNCQYISAHTIVANVGAYTFPGVMPAYVRIEVLLLGVGGVPNPLFPQEAVEKVRVIAFSTDPSQLLDVYALDVDACGNQSNRFYGTGDPFGPPIGKKGRAKFITNIGSFLPPTRNIRVASRTLTGGLPIDAVLPTAKTYANGLIAGQYNAPNFTFIFPENLIIGSPQVPFTFQEFPFLVNGSGPYLGFGTNASLTSYGSLGQLSPWPGTTPAAPLGCGPTGLLTAPIPNAGPAQTVNSGATVLLNGTASADTNVPPLPLSYTWLQTGGPPVVLNDAGFPKPFFTAPVVAAGAPPVVLSFSLVVSNGFTSSGVSTTTVTVIGSQNPIASAGADQVVPNGVVVTLSGSAIDPNGAAGLPLSFQWTQTAGPAVTLAAANTATATFTAPLQAVGQGPILLTFKLTVTNKLGLTGASTVNVTVQPLQDIVTIISAVYRLTGSRLTVVAASSITSGIPVLTLTIPNFGKVQLTFDPGLKTYSTVAGVPIVNPIPVSVTVTSSFGGSATSPVTRIR